MQRISQKTTRGRYGKQEDRYLELIRQFPLRPLTTQDDLDVAVDIIDTLIDRDVLTPPEQDYLDVLSDLVETYETEHVPIGRVDDSEMLKFLVEQSSLTQAAFAKKASISVSTISEILSGKRKLNRNQISKLVETFHVPSGAFH